MLKTAPAEKMSYQQLFEQYCDFNPHQISLAAIKTKAIGLNIPDLESIDDYLDVLLSHLIEPKLGLERPVFIYDYPASQAALAKINKQSPC